MTLMLIIFSKTIPTLCFFRRAGFARSAKRLQSAWSNVASRGRFTGAQSTMTDDAEHPFTRDGDNRSSRESVFDTGIAKGGCAFRQLPVAGLFFTPVEAAARHAVECAVSTLKHAEAMT